MTEAQKQLIELAEWLASSSKARSTAFTQTPVGRYAVLVPSDFAEPPRDDFDAEALPLYIEASIADGMSLPPIVTAAPMSQGHMADRLAHMVNRIEDGTLGRGIAIVGIIDPAAPLQEAIDAAVIDDIDRDAHAIVAVPLWRLPASYGGAAAIFAKLPVLPVTA